VSLTELYTKTRAEEIQDSLFTFTEKYLNSALNEYASQLLKRVQQNHRMNIFKGDVRRWAAGVIYVLARFNFLFDKEDTHHITPDLIRTHFSMDRSAVLRKADKIEKACALNLGDRDISSDKINSMLKFFNTPSGFVIPKLYIDTCLQNIASIDKPEAEWLKAKVEEKIILEKEKRRARMIRLAEKKQCSAGNQLNLF